ncbi:restriction endonuclease subunit S [Psychrobacter sp. KFRI-CH2-11]
MINKLPRYSSYTDTDIDWIEKYPSHWQLIPCRAVVDHIVEKNEGGKIQNYLSLMANVGVIRYEDKGDIGNKKPEDLSKCKIVKKGQLVINSMNYSIGSYGMSPYNGVCSSVYIILEPKKNLLNRYGLRVFENSAFQKHLATFGNGILAHRAAIGWDDIKGEYIPLAPKDEQEKILQFLDHETNQIDTLIEKQQTLIQLLKEKRQAVISHAVTKGLNPDAPMKDSGVEWLGEVPEHWIVTKFSHCAQIRNGLVDPKAPDFKKLVLYAPNHIEKGTGKIVYKETAEEQGADSSKYLCYKGEVIYSKIRPALAKVAICEEETALCSADMYPINAVNGLDNRFLYFFMLSDNFTKAAILDSDRVAMPKINRESLSDYRLPVPPVIEQMAICKFIANQNTKLEELESKATKAIQLMQERRTALISAAVTGKIDVRGWRAPE